MIFISFYQVTGVTKFLYDLVLPSFCMILLLSSNGIVDSWEIDKQDLLVKILLLRLPQQIGVAVVVVMYVGWCWR